MNSRLAKKIVQRVQDGTATHLSYRQSQVQDAFRILGVTPTDVDLKPWTDAETARAAAVVPPEELEARRQANEAHKEEVAKRQKIRQMRAAALGRQNFLRAQRAAQINRGSDLPDPEPVVVGSGPEGAAAAAREVFRASMARDSVPTALVVDPLTLSATANPPPPVEIPQNFTETVTGGDTTEELITYEEMVVADLRAIARERGLGGYSHMKKSELVELLTTNP